MQREVSFIARGKSPGTTVLQRRCSSGENLVRTVCSVLSPGTERWQLGLEERGDAPLGYMAIGAADGEHILAPAPHGTHFDAADSGLLTAPASPEIMAIARFQLMAAAGLRPFPERLRGAERFAVVGTGPVGIGAVLEILRSSGAQVTVITGNLDRARQLLGHLDRVTVGGPEALRGSPNVLECTGQAERIAACIDSLAPGAFVGLLGSPRAVCALDLYAVHRAGALLAGMHELARFDPVWRRNAFREIARWLAATDPHGRGGWLAWTPASELAGLYTRLQRSLLAEPFQLLDWREQP